MDYLDTYTKTALIKQEAFWLEHKTQYRQLPACSCGLKNSTIYHLIARLDLDRWICIKCRDKEEESEEESEEQGEETVSRKPHYIKSYPYLDTTDIKRFIKKNPGCLYDFDIFVGLSPLEYVERLYNSTQYLLLDPWTDSFLSESHRGGYVLHALQITSALFKKQIVKTKRDAQNYIRNISQDQTKLFSKLPPEIWMYIFDFIKI